MALLALVVLLFFWKLVLTRQYSLLVEYEGANVAYAWSHFTSSTLQEGSLPLWDPYTHGGRSFVGEMQTALFYPLKLILYFWPFNRSGLVSPQLLHWFYILAHVLAAWFMFLLAEEMGLSRFPAFLAAICFSLIGFVGKTPWLYMLDGVIWLPLILLFLLRALRSTGPPVRILNSGLAGLSLGMVVLAGGLHAAMMDVAVVVSAAIYWAVRESSATSSRRAWRHAALVVAIVGLASFSFAAIQLLPSIEYSGLAMRYYGGHGTLPASQRVPYTYSESGLHARAVMAFALAWPFSGDTGGEFSPYFGFLTLLLVIMGIWRGWDRQWVRYFTMLGAAAFIYSLGKYSILHGLVYVLVPYMWMAVEAGRLIYLTHFAMALLAGFGTELLFSDDGAIPAARFAGLLKWFVAGAATVVAIPALYGKSLVNDWICFSLFLTIASWAVLAYIARGHRTPAMKFLVVAVILAEQHPFHWQILDIEKQRANKDHLETLLAFRPAARFLKEQPGLFRVHMAADPEPNTGDLYALQTTGGMSATVLRDYHDFYYGVPRAYDLLNVRYVVRPATATEPNPVFSDAGWKVYENPTCFPRAWVVHQAIVEPSPEAARKRVADLSFDPSRTAVVSEPLAEQLDVSAERSPAEISFVQYRPTRFSLRVRSAARGLLVLSEIHYPGWQATVNGQAAHVYKVNGLLRGIVVPAGESQVEFRYAPRSILAGAVLSLAAMLGTGICGGAVFMQRRRRRLTPATGIA